MARADRALAAQGYDGLIVASGSLRYLYLDDNSYPFKPNPRYRSWVPDGTPDCFVVYRPGGRPSLVFHQPDDYWYLPPALPEGYWVASFDLRVVRSPAELKQFAGAGDRWAILGEPSAVTEGHGDHEIREANHDRESEDAAGDDLGDVTPAWPHEQSRARGV